MLLSKMKKIFKEKRDLNRSAAVGSLNNINRK